MWPARARYRKPDEAVRPAPCRVHAAAMAPPAAAGFNNMHMLPAH